MTPDTHKTTRVVLVLIGLVAILLIGREVALKYLDRAYPAHQQKGRK